MFVKIAPTVFRILFMCARAQISYFASDWESALSDHHPVVFVRALISVRRTIIISNLRLCQSLGPPITAVLNSLQSRQCARFSFPISVHVFPHHLCFAVRALGPLYWFRTNSSTSEKAPTHRHLRNNRHSANHCFAGQRTIYAAHLWVCPCPGYF